MILGHPDPMRMVAQMSRRTWVEWQVFLQLEPPESVKADYRAAQLLKVILDYLRDPKKKPHGYTIEECLLRLGDDAAPGPTRRQTWQEKKALLFGMMNEHAVASAASKGRRRSR